MSPVFLLRDNLTLWTSDMQDLEKIADKDVVAVAAADESTHASSHQLMLSLPTWTCVGPRHTYTHLTFYVQVPLVHHIRKYMKCISTSTVNLRYIANP
jgi:hypothetical protein